MRILSRLNATIRRVTFIVSALLIVAAPQIASAQNTGYSGLSDEELERLGIYFARGNYNCDNDPSTTVSSSTGGDTNAGSWNSGLQPPYILEQFMIEVLKDIAQKRGVTAQETVTEEHVIALVAFAIGEGGDINNQDIFNPLNTGINAPDLTVNGEHVTNGKQSFKSFDAGVEANARVMTGQNQRRLSDILIQPNSNAQQFMEALTYFNRYTDNKLWAEASLPPHADSYYQERLRLVNQVRRNYPAAAALVIGTPELEFQTRHIIASKLQFHPASSTNKAPADTASATSAAQTASCACTTGEVQPVIVVDPGHSGKDIDVVDSKTNIRDHDYPNSPEMQDMWDVSQLVKAKLTDDGYKVILTKKDANDTVSHRARAEIANSNNAALAISLHDQAGKSGGLPFASENNHVYVQKNGLYREDQTGKKVAFNNDAVANLSAVYGQNFVTSRTEAEGHKVDIDQANLGGRAGLADGNIWLVQLFSKVPWIYNEAGGVSSGDANFGLSDKDKQKYATGVVNGVEKSVPIKNCAEGAAGSFTSTVLAYAWPDKHDAPYLTMTDANSATSAGQLTRQLQVPCINGKTCYRQAVDAALARRNKGQNDYVGGGSPGGYHPGIDCGGFVTRLFRDSGVDPQYNSKASNVRAQFDYLESHKDKYQLINPKSSKQLRKGDIYIAGDKGHTYVFVGENTWSGNKTRVKYDMASASISDRPASNSDSSWRSPMAGYAYDIEGAYWFRPLFPVN